MERTNLTPNAAGEAGRLAHVHSHEIRDEQRPGRLPPSPPPFVPSHASRLLEHPYEVLITGIDSTLDEQPAAAHRLVEMRNQFASPLAIEPVGIRHESETSRAIEVSEPEAAGALIVIDRDAHPCECGEVEDGAARSRSRASVQSARFIAQPSFEPVAELEIDRPGHVYSPVDEAIRP